jgi:heat shock protein HslJ
LTATSRVLAVALCALALSALAACGGDDDDDTPSGTPRVEGKPATASDLQATPWQLTSYAVSGSDNLSGATEDAPGTAQFENGTVNGSTGCNNYHASYQLPNAGDIDFGPVAATQAACGDSATTAQEQGMLKGFDRASRVVLNNTDLQFLDDRNTPVLVFEVAKPKPLEGTAWKLLSYRTPTAVTSALNGAEITASFENGTMSGSAGCNNYTAPYTGGGDGASGALKIGGNIAMTQKLCTEPEGVTEQEQVYTAALGTVTSFEIVGNELTLLDAQGRDAATYQG